MAACPHPSIIVVGAAGGIGLEIVRLAQGRARVLAVVQNNEQVEAAQKAGAQQCFVCDVADPVANRRCSKELTEQLNGPLNALIFCAAMQPIGATEVLERTDLERLFAVNVFGTLQLVQALIPTLLDSSGRIVLFSSMAGRLVAPMLGGYSASKYALEALADALRVELRDSHVSLSLIEPGGVDTPMAKSQAALVEGGLSKLQPDMRQRYERLYRGYLNLTTKALRHASRPEHVAQVAVNAALDRATPKSRYVVGIDARMMVLLKRVLPAGWFDRLLIAITTLS